MLTSGSLFRLTVPYSREHLTYFVPSSFLFSHFIFLSTTLISCLIHIFPAWVSVWVSTSFWVFPAQVSTLFWAWTMCIMTCIVVIFLVFSPSCLQPCITTSNLCQNWVPELLIALNALYLHCLIQTSSFQTSTARLTLTVNQNIHCKRKKKNVLCSQMFSNEYRPMFFFYIRKQLGGRWLGFKIWKKKKKKVNNYVILTLKYWKIQYLSVSIM